MSDQPKSIFPFPSGSGSGFFTIYSLSRLFLCTVIQKIGYRICGMRPDFNRRGVVRQKQKPELLTSIPQSSDHCSQHFFIDRLPGSSPLSFPDVPFHPEPLRGYKQNRNRLLSVPSRRHLPSRNNWYEALRSLLPHG